MYLLLTKQIVTGQFSWSNIKILAVRIGGRRHFLRKNTPIQEGPNQVMLAFQITIKITIQIAF